MPFKEHEPSKPLEYPRIGEVVIPMVPVAEFDDSFDALYQAQWTEVERDLPQELADLRNRRVQELIADGKKVHNSEALSLASFSVTPDRFTVAYEKTHYFSFVSTHLALDEQLPSGKTVRQTYGDLEQMTTQTGYTESPYAKLVGISQVILTNDDKIIIQQRSQRTAIAAGKMHVSLAEGMKRTDIDEHGTINPLVTAKRGIRQELESGNVSQEEINQRIQRSRVIAMGISREFLQPEFVVLTEMNQSSEELLEAAKHARSQWERFSIQAVDFNQPTIEALLKEFQWSPHAQFALYEALRVKGLLK